jgi:REP element-mobilizing transposase RayT
MSAPTYHIIWTTYGTWLPGDVRGWIQKNRSGVQLSNPDRERIARNRMAESEVILSSEQIGIVERTIRKHCRMRQWRLHAVNVLSNHVHIVISANCPGDDIMKQLKAWCSRELSDALGLHGQVAKRAGRRRWFTENGDVNVIEDEQYFHNAVNYVLHGQ